VQRGERFAQETIKDSNQLEDCDASPHDNVEDLSRDIRRFGRFEESVHHIIHVREVTQSQTIAVHRGSPRVMAAMNRAMAPE
jgi:hypothetical protein